MKPIAVSILLIVISHLLLGQSHYENPLGFTLSFDNTWKRLPKEVWQQKIQSFKDDLDYQKEVNYEACYQKIGNADMDYPYILFKNYYTIIKDEDKIDELQKFYTNKEGIENVITKIENGKIDIDLEVGKSYLDRKNRLLIITYELDISIRGKLVGLMAFYFGTSGSLQICCYSYKDEFKYDQDEFLEIIYSIKDVGMQTELGVYLKNHDMAVSHYNEGLKASKYGNKNEAIKYYTLAINKYPSEDKYQKSEAYFNRGVNKRSSGDLHGAISDYTKAIELRHDNYKAYNNRGFAKLILEQYSSAIGDFTMTIKFDNYQTEFTNIALGNRGIAKISIGQNGCEDLRKAIEEGNTKVQSIFREYCN